MKAKFVFVCLFATGIFLAGPIMEVSQIAQGQSVTKDMPACDEDPETGVPDESCQGGPGGNDGVNPPSGGEGGNSACCGNNHLEVNGTCYSCFHLAFKAAAGTAYTGNGWLAIGAGFVTYVACRLAC